jgi:hypothetical protein
MSKRPSMHDSFGNSSIGTEFLRQKMKFTDTTQSSELEVVPEYRELAIQEIWKVWEERAKQRQGQETMAHTQSANLFNCLSKGNSISFTIPTKLAKSKHSGNHKERRLIKEPQIVINSQHVQDSNQEPHEERQKSDEQKANQNEQKRIILHHRLETLAKM